MAETKAVPQKRVIVYMPSKDYDDLRVALLRRKKPKTVSAWFRDEAAKVISVDKTMER
jgi:hypothetical protein